MINRREAIARVGMIVGASVVGAEAFLSGCARPPGELGDDAMLDANLVAFFDEVGDVILPDTERSPGAKAAGIGEFMNVIVTDCYDDEDQALFATAAPAIDQAASGAYGANFLALDRGQQHELFVQIDEEARQHDESREPGVPPHYFSLVKQLTLWGYFTSEVGSTQALRYNPVPGRYEGCVDYTEGEGAWAAI